MHNGIFVMHTGVSKIKTVFLFFLRMHKCWYAYFYNSTRIETLICWGFYYILLFDIGGEEGKEGGES